MALAMVDPDELAEPVAMPDETHSLRALECLKKTRSLAWVVLAAAASSRASKQVAALVGAMLVCRVGKELSGVGGVSFCVLNEILICFKQDCRSLYSLKASLLQLMAPRGAGHAV